MTEESFLALAASKYALLKKLGELNNFYDHEKQFEQVWTEFGREALEQSIGEVPRDHRLKKNFKPLR